jgi:hypothetical protein
MMSRGVAFKKIKCTEIIFLFRLFFCFRKSYLILPVAPGPGVYSSSNRNEYQKHKNNVSGE